MKAPDIFIIIPDTTDSTHYIRPYDILSMEDRLGHCLRIYYKRGEEEGCIATLLTARGIHERMIELERQTLTFTFGE